MRKILMFDIAKVIVLVGVVVCPTNPKANAADVVDYGLKKGILYTQTEWGLPTIDSTNGYAFEADVTPLLSTSVKSASLQLPGSVTWLPLAWSASGKQLQFKHKYNSEKALNRHYPNGLYGFFMETANDGSQRVALQFPYSDYPDGPYIENYPAAQSVNANGYFQIAWAPFTGGTTNDFVQFRIEDTSGNRVYETPDEGKEGANDGTARGALIPPGLLAPNGTYRATLLFQKPVAFDRASYPGAVGEAACYTRTTLSLITGNALAPDVKWIELSKNQRWSQNSDGPVKPETGSENVFNASVRTYNTNAVTNATLRLPDVTNGSLLNLLLQTDGVTWDFTDVASLKSILDSFYENGVFTLDVNTIHDGNRSVSLTLPADDYPPAPHISNFNDLQTIDATQSFRISWDAWTTGGFKDFIQLRIEDHQNNRLFETPNLGKSGALTGLATNTIVPQRLLTAGLSYRVTLTFKRITTLDTTRYPAVLGLAYYSARTKFKLATVADNPPQLNLSLLPFSDQVQLTVQERPGQKYRIEDSTNLVQWTALTTNVSTNDVWYYKDTNLMQRPFFFYRVVVLP